MLTELSDTPIRKCRYIDIDTINGIVNIITKYNKTCPCCGVERIIKEVKQIPLSDYKKLQLRALETYEKSLSN